MTMQRFWRRLPLAGSLVLLATVTSVPVAADPPPPAPAAEVVGTGSITIVKDAVPNAATNFSYATTGAGVARSFALDDDTNPALARTRTFRNLAAGTYTFREAAVTGWALTRLACSRPETVNLGLRKVTIRLTAGENVRCTFTNSRRGSITIQKEVLGAVETHLAPDFDFTATGTGVSDFQLDDDQDFDPTLADTRTFSNLAPGAYRFVEEVEPGYFLTDLTCTTTERPQLLQRRVDITLSAGEHVTCTFENAAYFEDDSTGALQVVKLRGDTGPVTDFDYDVTGPGGFFGRLRLTPPVQWVGADWASFRHIAPGQYVIDEDVPTGWEVTGIVCTDPAAVVDRANGTATVAVRTGQLTRCTYANQPVGASPGPATLTVSKYTLPHDPTEFQFTSTANPGYTNFGLADGASVTFPVTPGRLYDVEELPLAGWALSRASCNRGTWFRLDRIVFLFPAPGQRIRCTFVNETAGSVTIRKIAQPTDDSLFHFDDWGDRYSLGEEDSFTLDDGGERTFENVAPGDYVLRERPEPGWAMSDASCTGGPGPAEVDHHHGVFEFDVGPGDDVVCTVTNVLVGHLTIRKDARPDDEQLFRFSSHTIPGLSPFPLSDGGSEANQVTLDVVPGIPTDVYELVPETWTLSDATCDAGDWTFSAADRAVTVTLLPDQAATCTFVNQRHGSITIVKDTRPDGPRDFFFTPSWQTGFYLDDDTDPTHDSSATYTDLAPGTYTVTESAVTGWQVADIACTGGTTVPNPEGRTVDITLAAGEDITCTFVNTPPGTTGSITIVKDTVTPDGQDFSFTPSWQTGFHLDDDADPTLADSVTFPALAAGSYTVSEQALAGWALTDLTCTTGEQTFLWGYGQVNSGTVVIDLTAGEDVTCTFQNQRTGSITIVKEATPADQFRFATTFRMMLDPTPLGIGGSLDLLVGGSEGPTDSDTFTELPPGNYTLWETVLDDDEREWFEDVDLSCTSGGTPVHSPPSPYYATNWHAVVDLGPGDHVTCTFENAARSEIALNPSVSGLSGSVERFDFSYDIAGSAGWTTSLTCWDVTRTCDTDFRRDLTPGTWTITQTATSPDAALVDIACESSGGGSTFTPDLDARRVTIELHGHDTMTCDFQHLESGGGG